MTPIKFPEQNMTFAEDQPEYLPLPAYKSKIDPHGNVITCWRPTLIERIKILFGKTFI